MPLRRLYLLEPESPAVAIAPASPRAAVLGLVSATVAARLFDAELQARHLEACIELAELTDVRRLRLPRTADSLPEVVAALEEDLETP